jgi:hypothetical protein
VKESENGRFVILKEDRSLLHVWLEHLWQYLPATLFGVPRASDRGNNKNNQVEEDEMGESRSTYGGEEERV